MKTTKKTTEEKEVIICDNCDKEANEQFTFNGVQYCEECFNELFFTCDDCGEIFSKDELYVTSDGDNICDNCYCDSYFTCDKCGEIHNINYSTEVNGEYWCNDCLNHHALYCNYCNCWHNDNYISYVSSADSYVCEDCINERFYYCDSCGEYYPNGNSCNCDDSEEKTRLLLNYSHKPRLNFLKLDKEKVNNEFYGIELECEAKKEESRNEAIEEANKDLNKDCTYVFFKEDGSLDDNKGFEIVTHPSSYNFHINNICAKVNNLRQYSNSFDNGNCGVHIHVSRLHIGENRESENITIGKLLFFFANNNKFIETIAQRKSERWSKIDEKRNIVYKIKYQYDSDRYTAINLKNSNTIEFRIFRGTLNTSSFTKNLQFVKSIIDFCKSVNFTKLTVNDYLQYLRGKQYTELNNFILYKWTAKQVNN